MNNVAALNLFLNRVEKAYGDFKLILDRDQMNSFNEVTFTNINLLSEIFNIPKYPN